MVYKVDYTPTKYLWVNHKEIYFKAIFSKQIILPFKKHFYMMRWMCLVDLKKN